MAFKTLLVHCDSDATAEARIKVAFDLADADAHVIGLFVREGFQGPAFASAGRGMEALHKSYEAAARAEEAGAMELFTAIAHGSSRSSAWRAVAGSAVDGVLADEAHCADLVIVGQGERNPLPSSAPPGLAENLAMVTERPVLVVPFVGVARPPGKKVLLCWNGSRESARAATGALPILRTAEIVTVLIVDPKVEDENLEPGADVVGWLARHGVKARLQRDSAADTDVGTVILSRAADLDVDLIVMGIYGHSRLRATVLGGASRVLLGSMTAPLLIAH